MAGEDPPAPFTPRGRSLSKLKLSAYRFKELVKHTLKSRPSSLQHTFSAHDYSSFWQCLDLNPGLTAFFFKQLVSAFLDTFERARKALKPGRQRQSYDGFRGKSAGVQEWIFQLSAYAHTLDYVSHFCFLDPAQKTFGDALEKFENYSRVLTAKNRQVAHERCQELWQQVSAILSRTKRKAMEQTEAIDLIVLDCTFAYSLAKIESHLPRSFSILCDFPFFPAKLLQIFQDPKRARERYAVFTAVTRFLQKITSQLVHNPAIAAKPLGNIMSIFVLLSVLLHAYPVRDRIMLRKVQSIVGEFTRWPKPYASYFRKLFALLKAEEASPGSARDMRLKEFFPALCIGASTGFSEDMDTKRRQEFSNTQATVVVLFDQWMARCNLLQRIMSSGDEFGSVKEISIDYKVRFLTAAWGAEKARSKLKRGSAERISQWYSEALAKDRAKFRPRTRSRSRSRSRSKSEASTKTRSRSGHTTEPGEAQRVESSEENVDLRSWAHVMVCPPSAVLDYGTNIGHHEAIAVVESPQGPEQIPIDTLLRPGVAKYIDPGREKSRLLGQLRRASPGGDSTVESKLRVAVLGCNRTLHRLLCSLLSLRVSYADVYKSVHVQIYIVPVGRNDVAAHLALQDGWYRRHVFVPFVAPPVICPQLSVRFKPESFDVDTAIPGPCGKYRQLMESYVRDAQETVPVFVFDCECWINADVMDAQTADEDPYVKIPFCCRAEIGLKAAAARFASVDAIGGVGMKSSDKDVDSNYGYGKLCPELRQVLHDRNFVRTGVGPGLTGKLSIHHSTEGAGLGSVQSGTLEETALASVIISNCPAYTLPNERNDYVVGQEAFTTKNSVANPTRPSLELAVLPCSSALMELLKKKDKKSREVDTVFDTMQNETVSYYCNVVEIVAKEKPFDIALDDQIYGPFFKIRIKQTTLDDGPFKLPVQVFSPLDL